MTDFAAVAEDIYRRKETLFNTGNLSKNIERLCKNNQQATPAIVEIAENLKNIADNKRVNELIPEIKSAKDITEINKIKSNISDYSKEAQEKVQSLIENKELELKKERFNTIEIQNERMFKENIKGASTKEEVEQILSKAKNTTAGKTFNKINAKALEKIKEIRREEADQLKIKQQEEKRQRLENEKKQKEEAKERKLAELLEKKEEARRIQREAEIRKKEERRQLEDTMREEREIAERIAREEI